MEIQSGHLDENDLGDGIGLIWETACTSGISLAMHTKTYPLTSLSPTVHLQQKEESLSQLISVKMNSHSAFLISFSNGS